MVCRTGKDHENSFGLSLTVLLNQIKYLCDSTKVSDCTGRLSGVKLLSFAG